MWFKQIQIFQLRGKIFSKANTLEEKLSQFEFNPCLSSLPSSHGFVPIYDNEGAPLVHVVNNYMLICLQIEEKLLPTSIVRQALDDKIKEIQKAEERKVGRKEKQQLKDEITFSLLPQAFAKRTKVYAYIDPENECIILNTTNKRYTELFLDAMEKTISAFKCHRPELKKLRTLMTHWVADGVLPKSFYLEKTCVLQDTQYTRRSIRVVEQDVVAKPMLEFIKDGCEVKQLALSWHDHVTFTLTDDFYIRNVKYSDEIKDQAKAINAEESQMLFEADFYIMTETLGAMFKDLFSLVLKAVDEPELA